MPMGRLLIIVSNIGSKAEKWWKERDCWSQHAHTAGGAGYAYLVMIIVHVITNQIKRINNRKEWYRRVHQLSLIVPDIATFIRTDRQTARSTWILILI